jgi:hypothetical protein
MAEGTRCEPPPSILKYRRGASEQRHELRHISSARGEDETSRGVRRGKGTFDQNVATRKERVAIFFIQIGQTGAYNRESKGLMARC